MGKKPVKDVQEIWEELVQILSSEGYRDIAPESTAKTLGMDSLDAIEMVTRLEDTFNVKLEDDFIGIGDSLLSLAGKLKEKMEWQESSPTP